MIDPETLEYIVSLASHAPEITSIWLYGSRANGNSSSASDWDFLVFGSELTLAWLTAERRFHCLNTDLLVVTDMEHFRNAWGNKAKSGSLTDWEWKEESALGAKYTESKWVQTEEQADIVSRPRIAIKVWPIT